MSPNASGGCVAQRESTPFTREGSQVQSLSRPPPTAEIPPCPDAAILAQVLEHPGPIALTFPECPACGSAPEGRDNASIPIVCSPDRLQDLGRRRGRSVLGRGARSSARFAACG